MSLNSMEDNSLLCGKAFDIRLSFRSKSSTSKLSRMVTCVWGNKDPNPPQRYVTRTLPIFLISCHQYLGPKRTRETVRCEKH